MWLMKSAFLLLAVYHKNCRVSEKAEKEEKETLEKIKKD